MNRLFADLLRAQPKTALGVVLGPNGFGVAQAGQHITATAEGFCHWQGCEIADRNQQLRQFVREKKLQNSPCVVVLGRDDYRLVQVDQPAVPDAELPQALRYAIKDLLDYPLSEAVVDGFVIPPSARGGDRPMMNVVVAQASILTPLVESIAQADLKLAAIDVPELALRNLMRQIDQLDTPTLLLFLYAEQGVIQISQGDRLFVSRSIQLSATPDPAELALELRRSLDYFESMFAVGAAVSLWLAGSPSSLAMADSIAEALGLALQGLSLEQFAGSQSAPLAVGTEGCLVALGGALRSPESFGET